MLSQICHSSDYITLCPSGSCAAQVMKAFYALPVPQPGEEVEFLPDRELQPVHYARPCIVDMAERIVHCSPLAAAEAEAAEALQCWTVACLCRSLSIDNILTFLTGECPCGACPAVEACDQVLSLPACVHGVTAHSLAQLSWLETEGVAHYSSLC